MNLVIINGKDLLLILLAILVLSFVVNVVRNVIGAGLDDSDRSGWDRRRLRVTAVDVNRTACDLTFINTTLWGIPCHVVHGNTLSLETWGAWSNIHFICPWLPLAMRLQTDEAKAQGKAPTREEMAAIAAQPAIAGQASFDFGDAETPPAETAA